jgi:uncharacterized protein (TIGR02453 family)
MADSFVGFPETGLAFLTGLAADNTRTFFDTHRRTYERDLLAPMRLFVTDVAEQLRATVAPAIQAEPTVGKSLFRINRDIRFSKDKTPYIPWMDATWWEGLTDARRAPAYIFRLTADHVVIGAGIVGLRDDQLDRFRRAVANESSGKQLRAALDELASENPEIEVTTPTRKRVPALHPQDHPRRDLLRLESLHASKRVPHPNSISSSRFADWTVKHLCAFTPVHRWLVNALA